MIRDPDLDSLYKYSLECPCLDKTCSHRQASLLISRWENNNSKTMSEQIADFEDENIELKDRLEKALSVKTY